MRKGRINIKVIDSGKTTEPVLRKWAQLELDLQDAAGNSLPCQITGAKYVLAQGDTLNLEILINDDDTVIIDPTPDFEIIKGNNEKGT